MTTDALAVYRAIQGQARSQAAHTGKPVATGELLTRHALESFLHRLTQTDHAPSFVLKGGVLLTAYDVRRPTRDLDAEAVDAPLTAEHLSRVVDAVIAVESDDGIEFNREAMSVQQIRDDATYSGLRMRLPVTLASWRGTIAWDVSTGDPIVPAPHVVHIPRVLGDPIPVVGYRPETVIAEKGVTILERGTTSTRWRDYVDIVQLPVRHEIDQVELRHAAESVAGYRKVDLAPIGELVAGYGDIAQGKWAAWRRKEGLQDITEPLLDDQIERVATVLDPVFGLIRNGPSDSAH
ncbi:nucleotidyl transferase AbiEii/AbiGii toxin family protein [Myceligenerans salitolerans]|uniref:Nucleotidyl transferase AbiEii/AbiGii toxin family protein n=1 Tax=Myceligenerans salitolerans TaxID=1230528 RepID=A0ABS3ID08_9MICO|nr:nucleotidyl transferase AbiEii/AbiGii toxin family protein [Myceligenerans salitolerans]MBO0610911.1 nucleotidyl transferase AbiEii/AbiGii toxin family protein [Myceligenerans salitolerans]